MTSSTRPSEPQPAARRLEAPARSGHPPCLVLPASADAAVHGQPQREPVRIFLGTEDRQARALRVFLFSVEHHRDPLREYRVYLMKDLPGFDRRGWRTGFTLYRFAIPEFAGGSGRAIYNDVDQIYTTDPAHLFDLPLGDRGYLAVSAEDTSVMLLDCARMLPWWNLDGARGGAKKALIGAGAASGMWGTLDGGWNARDDEYVEGKSGVLHYTALHMQPWTPDPEHYSYHPNPLTEVWDRLERTADGEGYEPFTSALPSPWHAAARRRAAACEPTARTVEPEVAAALGASGLLLWCTPGAAGAHQAPLPGADVVHWNYAEQDAPDRPGDVVAVCGVLEHLPAEDVPWALEHFCRHARRLLYVAVDAAAGDGDDDAPPPRSENWWRRALRRAAAGHPHLGWHLDYRPRAGTGRVCVHSEPRQALTRADAPPRVWVLTGPRRGDAEQVRTLAGALGWPWEEKVLDYNALHHVPNLLLGASTASIRLAGGSALRPPWPDLIIGCGKRSVPVARWVQRQSEGQTRLVFLGRPWAPLDWFDLVITTPQYGLPLRPNVCVNALPLNRPSAAGSHAEWRERLAHLPRPWIGLLIGGSTGALRFDAAAARELARSASAMARQAGGSLLVTTSPRTSPQAADALVAVLDVPAYVHRWQPDDQDNPLHAFLALGDRFVVTGDSASMLADAIATGKTVAVATLPKRATRLDAALRRSAELLLGLQRRSYRGTPKQQNRRQRAYDGLVALGVLQTFRDIDRLVAPLARRGVITLLDAPASDQTATPIPLPDELALTADRIRERAGERRWRR